MSNNALKAQIRQELTDLVAKNRAAIKKLEDQASGELFLRSTVSDGLLGTAAKNACTSRADEATRQAKQLKAEIAWHEEMLQKYR